MRTIAICLVLVISLPALADNVLYVSIAGEKRIAVFKVDADDGRLTPAGSVSTSGEPGALTTDPKRHFLFAALRSTGDLSAFRIDPANGALTHINTVPAGADPAHISTDKTGRFLLTAYYVAGKVTIHAIGTDGSLSKVPKQSLTTKEKAHAIVLDPLEMAAVVPHTGPNVIYAIPWVRGRFETERKKLTFATSKNTGPRHIVFHPTLTILGGVDLSASVAYIANEQGSSVTLYHAILNPYNWKLEPKQTISTLPADFQGTNACAEIRLHPSHRYLYVSNRGHDSLAAFQLEADTGRLKSLGQTLTEKTPRSFDIDPSGKFLFAAGESSGRLAGYRVEEASGKLRRIATYDLGKMPWWVLAIRLPDK